jgi:hypothetical protein
MKPTLEPEDWINGSKDGSVMERQWKTAVTNRGLNVTVARPTCVVIISAAIGA